jgi:hypothetical protein
MSTNPYQFPIIRAQLTRALPQLVPEVHDKIADASNDFIPLSSGEFRTSQQLLYHPDIGIDWTGVKALETFMKVVCRASIRVFVGRPLCESLFIHNIRAGRWHDPIDTNPDFVALNIQFTVDVIQTGALLRPPSSSFPSTMGYF